MSPRPLSSSPRRSGSRRRAPDPLPERSAHRLYAQLAWATFDDLPLIAAGVRSSLADRLVAICRRLDVDPVAVRITARRVRLLVRFKPGQALAPVTAALKSASQDALVVAGHPVRWSRGFVVASVGPSDVRALARRMREGD